MLWIEEKFNGVLTGVPFIKKSSAEDSVSAAPKNIAVENYAAAMRDAFRDAGFNIDIRVVYQASEFCGSWEPGKGRNGASLITLNGALLRTYKSVTRALAHELFHELQRRYRDDSDNN